MSDKKPKLALIGGKSKGAASEGVRNHPIIEAQAPTQGDIWNWDTGITVSTLLGSGGKEARSRAVIYDKWATMEADPFVGAALKLHVTAALAGDPETGDAVFIETRNGFEGDKEAEKLVDELKDIIQPMINEIATGIAHNGFAFGDAYARVYSDNKRGVYHLISDELLRPPLILPFEKGGKTVGYVAYSGDKAIERLTVRQIARLKMPRNGWVPQPDVIEKSYRTAMVEDDLEKAPLLPSMVGGSILYSAESAFDDLRKSLIGLVGQRWVDSMDEQILTLNMESMSKDQQAHFLKSIKDMLNRSKKLAEKAMQSGTPMLERIRHLIPVFGEKGAPTILGNAAGSGRAAAMTIDDIMFHAKSLAGSLGTDLSQIGWADMLAGGLGEGGYARTSMQIAENSAMVKRALAGFIQHVIDIHTHSKYGIVYPASKRPWRVVFYGTVSALENERQNTRLQAMNAGGMLGATIQQLKDMGFNAKQLEHYLTKQMMIDEDEARIYADVANATPPDDGSGDFGGEPEPPKNNFADQKARFSKKKPTDGGGE